MSCQPKDNVEPTLKCLVDLEPSRTARIKLFRDFLKEVLLGSKHAPA